MSGPSEPPPRDLPGDYAVIRSVGAMLFRWDGWDGPWRWDGRDWQPCATPQPRSERDIVPELAEFLRTVMEDGPRDG